MFISGHGWREVGRGLSNSGRPHRFLRSAGRGGVYRMMFDIASYLPNAFFPSVAVMFEISQVDQQHHIPLLLSAFGYSVFLG